MVSEIIDLIMAMNMSVGVLKMHMYHDGVFVLVYPDIQEQT